MSGKHVQTFTDDEAKALLARAIELEDRIPLTTMDDLRAIAAEIGVSSASLEAALRERSPVTESRAAGRRLRLSTGIAAVGVPLGVAVGAVLTSTAIFSAPLLWSGMWGATWLASGAVLLAQGRHVTVSSFVVRNVALWGGVAAGSLAAIAVIGTGSIELPWVVTLGTALRNLLASTVIGSAAVMASARPPKRSEGGTSGAAADSLTARIGAGVARTATRIRRLWGALPRRPAKATSTAVKVMING